MAGEKSLFDLIRKIRSLRREWGATTCDLLLAELITSGSVTALFDRLGLHDPQDPEARLQVFLEYLRDHGSTEFENAAFHTSEPFAAASDPPTEIETVDSSLLQALVQEQARLHPTARKDKEASSDSLRPFKHLRHIESGFPARNRFEEESVSDELYFGFSRPPKANNSPRFNSVGGN